MPKGKKAHHWTGGTMRNDGYIYRYTTNHPFKIKAPYVLEHRLVMEQWLRENNPNHSALIEIDGELYLRPEWIPHHKNEKRDDNRIENLELMTVKEHRGYHNKKLLKGKHLSLAHRRKLSSAHKGKRVSEKTKRKISDSQKKLMVNPKLKEIRMRNLRNWWNRNK